MDRESGIGTGIRDLGPGSWVLDGIPVGKDFVWVCSLGRDEMDVMV